MARLCDAHILENLASFSTLNTFLLAAKIKMVSANHSVNYRFNTKSIHFSVWLFLHFVYFYTNLLKHHFSNAKSIENHC